MGKDGGPKSKTWTRVWSHGTGPFSAIFLCCVFVHFFLDRGSRAFIRFLKGSLNPPRRLRITSLKIY